MKKIIKWGCFAVFALLLAGLIWGGLEGYTPSEDGRWEEKIAVEDMKNHCELEKLDCSDLRIVRRSPPVPGQACQFPNGEKPKCERTHGDWSFVARLKSGQEYSIVVLPDDIVFVGPYSQIYTLESQND